MYTIKAIYRRILWALFRKRMTYGTYNEGVTGWDGWYELGHRCICFRSDDGANVFKW